MSGDRRFTAGLMVDVFAALERHGYQRGKDPKIYADCLVELLHLVEAFEGKRRDPADTTATDDTPNACVPHDNTGGQ